MPKHTKPASTHMTIRDEDGSLRRDLDAIASEWNETAPSIIPWDRSAVIRNMVLCELKRLDPAAAIRVRNEVRNDAAIS